MFDRLILKENAKKSFRRNYWSCVLVSFICALLGGIFAVSFSGNNFDNIISGANGNQVDPSVWVWFSTASIIATIISAIASIFLRNPLTVSVSRFYYANREENAKLEEVKYPFARNRYLTIVGTIFVKQLLIGLFTLLFIIPGIIKAYDYYLVEYIIADYPDLTIGEALDKSKKMMRGYRWKTFILNLSFLPWVILSALTFGIVSIFYVSPYVTATNAELYYALKCISFPEDVEKEKSTVVDSDENKEETRNPFSFDSDENKDEDSSDSTDSTDYSSDLFD